MEDLILKTAWAKISNIMSWVFLIFTSCLLIFTAMTAINAHKTGEPAFLFGYRPVLVLTGSMEPYMMTNGIALTKEVDDISDLEVGDVVTYHFESESGRLLRITHRIIALDNGTIHTKGDNNRVSDGYTLTIDNIESEVVAVFNQTAWIAQKWQTTTGKIMIVSFAVAIILLYYTLKTFILSRKEKPETQDVPDPTAAPSEAETAAEEPAEAK